MVEVDCNETSKSHRVMMCLHKSASVYNPKKLITEIGDRVIVIAFSIKITLITDN